MGWILFGEATHNKTDVLAKYAPDLAADPFYRVLNTYHWVPLTVLGLVALAIGGWPAVYWVVFLRVVVGLHARGSSTRRRTCGARAGSTSKTTRRTAGGWRSSPLARAGTTTITRTRPPPATASTWYELDVSWITIRMMRAIGLAKRVRVATADG